MAVLTRTIRDRAWHILLVTLPVILGLVVYTIINLDSLRSSESQQSQRVAALSSALGGAQNQLKANGITPSQPAPSQIIAQPGPPGPQGSPGATGPGPSDAQVQAAVAAYLRGHPIAGQPPTTDQIAAVVAVYMQQHPAPSGSPGPSGATGPGPSDVQIAAAVETWEQAHPIVAPSGPAGPTGPSGPAGPSGAAGVPGSPGGPGPTGPAGPAPSGWEWVETPPVGHPQTHTCTPTSGTPSPQYSCS